MAADLALVGRCLFYCSQVVSPEFVSPLDQLQALSGRKSSPHLLEILREPRVRALHAMELSKMLASLYLTS